MAARQPAAGGAPLERAEQPDGGALEPCWLTSRTHGGHFSATSTHCFGRSATTNGRSSSTASADSSWRCATTSRARPQTSTSSKWCRRPCSAHWWLPQAGARRWPRNTACTSTLAVAALPDGYAERLTEIFPGTFANLRLLVLDRYDLALSKLERNIDRDLEDVQWLDLGTLRERYVNEVRPFVTGPVSRHDLTLELWVEMIEELRRAGA